MRFLISESSRPTISEYFTPKFRNSVGTTQKTQSTLKVVRKPIEPFVGQMEISVGRQPQTDRQPNDPLPAMAAAASASLAALAKDRLA